MINILFKDRKWHDNSKYKFRELYAKSVQDIEYEFNEVKFIDEDIVESVNKMLTYIEGSTMVSLTEFKDRYDVMYNISKLTIGVKAYILMLYNPDKYIDLSKCNDNVVGYFLDNLSLGNFFLPFKDLWYSGYESNNLNVLDKIIKDKYELYDYMRQPMIKEIYYD